MTIINAHFLRTDNHLSTLPITLQVIYNDRLRKTCAPSTISRSAKYSLPPPQVSMLQTNIEQLNKEEDANITDEDEDEDYQDPNDELNSPSINAARIGKQSTSTRSSISSRSTTTPYNPTICKVCGMTQNECHQAWNSMHDPDDPNKYCFRGPIFNPDKNIRENVLQYNLKHPEVLNHSLDKKEAPKKSKIPPPPPDLSDIPKEKPKYSYTKVSIPSERINEKIDIVTIPTIKKSPQQDLIKSNPNQPAQPNQNQTATIESLIKFIQNTETTQTNVCLEIMNDDESRE